MKKTTRATPETMTSIVDQTLQRISSERENLMYQKGAALGTFRNVATDLDRVNCKLRNVDSECAKLLEIVANEQEGVRAAIEENDKIVSRILAIIGE